MTRRAQGTPRTFSQSIGLAHSIVASGQPALISLRPGDQAGFVMSALLLPTSLGDKWVSNADGLALARRSGPASWLLRRVSEDRLETLLHAPSFWTVVGQGSSAPLNPRRPASSGQPKATTQRSAAMWRPSGACLRVQR